MAPKLGDLYRYLSNKLSDNVVMSGSGSTLFVSCESLDEQVRLMSIKSLFITVLDGATGKRHAIFRNFQPITK